ncbi:tyrosine--tRNA ligase [Sedimentibacter hydroxybenzoicus DSM 7310]|uniref:Tyrosine--tRNA ligase n=1 Tax=Sedimentibacter hydroxybenzoicus DSM 7310 TaxID=1123245 RepID=A0A974GXA2_SEDHY|nr:tyrosine--tRNA ligase [Sedimentibacter hydroxybenzoicus]NYB75006.1 tyrosine--tRNA ligase [Sedimentibacter hydroxybenzoicus DSM 7310]
MEKRNVFDVLKERGYIEQCTHEEEIRDLLGKESVTFYIGFDPTADSLHIGHYIQIMVMSIMQQHGHKPIALLGDGTTMIGDPSDRTGMRSVMTFETITQNAENFKKIFEKFLDFSDGKAIMPRNSEWLLPLNYLEFMRDVGVHFSVNKMLAADCYKNRMEQGLTFFEFGYMLMQSYDFYVLNQKYNCKMQFGGNDQWSNIIGGIELTRKKSGEQVYGMTFSLLTNSEGKKMGKTEKGALWLDRNKTTPYEFYQYWRNIDDADVEKCLALLTFIPMDEVRRLGALEGAEINKAKEILAYEVTKLIHSEEDAVKAQEAARALFGGSADSENIPATDLTADELGDGMTVIDLMIKANLIKTKSEGRRLIEQSGVSVNDNIVDDIAATVSKSDFEDGKLMIKKGKKTYHRIKLI